MPLTAKGQKILAAMRHEYGTKKGTSVFYASQNAGTISGTDPQHPERPMAHREPDADERGGRSDRDGDEKRRFHRLHHRVKASRRARRNLEPRGKTYKGKSTRPGGGGRFASFVDRLEAQGESSHEAHAVAGMAGRRKFGAHKMGQWSAAGRRRSA